VFTFVNPPSSSNRNNNSTASATNNNNATISVLQSREDDFVEVEPEVYYDEVIRSFKTFFLRHKRAA
jgi:hypothetical protein